MANNLTTTAANGLLTYIFGGTFTLTSPFKVALMTANGSATTAGTEVVGGSYLRQSVTVGTATNGALTNTNTLSFTSMPACTVVGIEIYDSTATPIRLWWGSITSKTVNAGDTLQIGASSLTLSLT